MGGMGREIGGSFKRVGIYVYLMAESEEELKSLFKKIIYFLLKNNGFIEFCCFLSNLNMN